MTSWLMAMEGIEETAERTGAGAAAKREKPLRLRAPDGEPLEMPAQALVLAGAVLVLCGLAVFAALRWEALSPAAQAAAAVGLAALPNAAGALVRGRLPRLATALHAAGTLGTGAALLLLGKILGLEVYGPAAMAVWLRAAAAGASAGHGIGRRWVRFRKVRLAGASLGLLAVQVMLAGSAVGLYWVQRLRCPQVAAQAQVVSVAGRYAALRLTVDGCRSTLPSAADAVMPRDHDGRPIGTRYVVRAAGVVMFLAQLRAGDGRLEAIRQEGTEHAPEGVAVLAEPGAGCEAMRLSEPVRFYLPAGFDVSALAGQPFWVRVTVPPRGVPRVVQADR